MELGHRFLRSSIAAALVMVGAIVEPAMSPSVAVAAPVLTVAQDIAGQTLIGGDTPVEVTIENTGSDPAFNVALLVRLPVGITIVGSDFSPSEVITETDAAGNPTGSVVAWENIVDIRAGGLFRFNYSLHHDVGTDPGEWAVSDVVSAPAEVYASDVDGTIPSVEPNGTTDPVSAVITGFTQSATAPGSTTLVPVLVRKSEPSVEGELLRGVHDHQTVYTVEFETGEVGGAGITTIEDWIPAGLEFLGCGTGDNSLTEEYPGAGPLNPGNAPPLTNGCIDPTSVETVDSGLPAGLPAGVYTHVVWDVTGASLPANTIINFSYVAGVPQRENTTTWPNGVPSTDGSQGSNLDNNTGPFTTQVGGGTVYTNLVQANTSFMGTDTTVEATESVQAVDLHVHKFVDSQEIQQGADSQWTLFMETSEYVVDGGIAGLEVTDITPDGLCPYASDHPGCGATPDANPPYTSTAFDGGNGRTELFWDLSSDTLGPNQDLYVVFETLTLSNYVAPPMLPVSTNDVFTNRVSLMGADVSTFGPDGPTGPTDINAVTDDSSASQSGTPVTFSKDAGSPLPDGSCGDGNGITWVDTTVAAVGPGDVVCFRLTARTPASLDAIEVALVDFLPPGFAYVTGSVEAGVDNEVPPSEVVFSQSGTADTGQRLQWTLSPTSYFEPARIAQIIFAAELVGVDGQAPDIGTSGDPVVNQARFSFENTNGEIFVVPDDAGGLFSEAVLDLTKGISAVDVPPLGDPVAYDPPIDPAGDVLGGSAVTFALDVTNDGSRDAIAVEVLDLLPVNDDGITVEDALCSQITIGTLPNPAANVTCTDGVGITWTDVEVPALTTVRLEYTWTLPASVSVQTSWTNEAGIVEYSTATNVPGVPYVYVPRDNIDPSREADANAQRARDDALIASPGITMTKTRTTSIIEPGNNGGNQATIGETISFRVVTRQSAGTAAEDYLLVDDLTDRGMTLDGASVGYRTVNVDPGTTCDFSGPFITTALTVTGNRIELAGDGALALVDEDGCLELVFDAVVEDAPDDAGEALNVRPNNVRNQAVLTFDADATAGVLPRTVTAAVNTQLVEPALRLDKRASALGDVLPGASIDYQLVITNPTGDRVATAHDLTVVDDFTSSAVASIVPGSISNGGTQAGDTIEWNLTGDPDGDGDPGLSPGATLTLTYSVVLEDNLVAGATLTNTAVLRGTSIDGPSVGERSALAGGESTCVPDACPGYYDTDTATLVVAGPTIEKGVADPLYTVGSEAAYGFLVTLPSGLDFGAVTVADDLAGDGVAFLDTITAQCTGCTPAEEAAFVAPAAGAADPVWDLGTLPASTNTRLVFIAYDARVVDDGAIAAGDTLTNTVTLTFGGGTRTDDATIEIAEPDVTLVKRVASPIDSPPRVTTPADAVPAEPDNVITYVVEVTNNGDWTAYDVAVADEPDSVETGGSCVGDPRLSTVVISSGPGWDLVDGTLGTGDSCLGWNIPALLPGGTIEITYQLQIPADFPRTDLIVGPEFVNVAEVAEYFGLADYQRFPPDVRTYPATAVTDEGHVNVSGGIIGDLVWYDVDADGLGPDSGDTGEPGLSGVDVIVTWLGLDGTVGGGDDIARTFTTDADGRWLTDDGTLPPQWLFTGNYMIAIDTATLPSGITTNTSAPDGTPDDTADLALAENEENLDQDFGYTGSAAVGDFVWLDLNTDGVQDADEPGIPGVGLDASWAGFDGTIGTADDIATGTDTTDGVGGYSIGDLPAGDTTVSVDTAALAAVGLDATYDLDSGTTAPDDTAVRALAVAETATDVDFGYAGTAELGDRVWLDYDADGIQDAGEPGIPGVTIELTWSGLDGTLGTADDVTLPDTMTAVDGAYGYTNLPAGDYTATVETGTLPAGLVATYDLDSGTTAPDGTTERSLTIGATATDVDFGYTGTGSIGDFVWYDLDADGVQDAGEPGIPGVEITATAGGLTSPVVTTASDGSYTITNLPAGDYAVTIDTSTLPVGLTPTYDLDGIGTADTAARTLAAGEDATDVDFGYDGTGAIGDFVWFDTDGDGTQDTGEPGIPGVDVTVTWAGPNGTFGDADDVDFPTATDADGLYLVGGLPPGNYSVTIDPGTLPIGLEPTADLDGIATPNVASLGLPGGANRTDVDFGYTGTGAIGDFVWFDIDGDGTQDVGEPGIPGVTVTIVWSGFNGGLGDADDVTYVASTDADGLYRVDDLPAGTFSITIDTASLPPGLVNTADPDGGLDDTADHDLGDGEVNLDQDFGYAGGQSIGDFVWLDVDGDGAQDAGEPGIPGVELNISWAGPDAAFGTADDVLLSTETTDALGAYLWPAAPAGQVRVTVETNTLPDGLAPTFDLDGGDDDTADRTVTVGIDALDVDFGYRGTGSVGDFVWLDLDGDGLQGLLEPGLAAVDLQIVWGGFDGTVGNADDVTFPTETTDAVGAYLAGNLPTGEVRVVVAPATLHPGLTQTFENDGTLDGDTITTLTVAAPDDLDVDFGYIGEHTIGDLVWLDMDGDGLGPDNGTDAADLAEPGLPNQPVFIRWAGVDDTLDTADDVFEIPTTTGPDGRWQITGVPDGPIRVRLIGGPAIDLVDTFDRDGTPDRVTEGVVAADDDTYDFGLTGNATLGDRVWLDFDADGVQDAGEPGIPGVDVTATWAGVDDTLGTPDDVTYPTTTTNADGLYLFTQIPAGLWEVAVDDATLPDGVTPTFDLDGVTTPNIANRNLGFGEVGQNVDFGYTGTAQLGNFVWWDLDGDGVQDPAEPGIPGAALTAVWSGVDGVLGTADDVVFPPATTDSGGGYGFDDLPAGDFRVRVIQASLPPGLSATFDLDGGDDSVAVRTLAVGDTANNVDFGYVGQLTIGDLVWEDVDQDGVRDPGEPAIAGADILLQYLGPDGAPDGGDDVFFRAVTANPPQIVPSGRLTQAAAPNAGDPYYEFPGLVPGNYVATLDPASLPTGMTPVSDLDGGDPVTTDVAITGDELDVDFVVFQNVAPLPPTPANTAQVACGSDVIVDPLAGVTDVNDDAVSLVPGSVIAPAGVTVEVRPDGDLHITTSPNVTDGAVVRWTVEDDHGATADVALALAVNCIDATAMIICSTTGARSLSYLVSGRGGPAAAPVTITWLDANGAALSVATNQALSGQVAWPTGVPLVGVSVEFRTADGARTSPIDPGGSAACPIIPSTGSSSIAMSSYAAGLLGAGLVLQLLARRRRDAID